MFQKKIITFLILIIIFQTLGGIYLKRHAILTFIGSSLSKENVKNILGEIKDQFASSEPQPLSSIEKKPLRKFQLTLAPSEWRRINENLKKNGSRPKIPGTLMVDGDKYKCNVRISGGGARHWNGDRKSIRLRFPPDSLFNGMREINLNIPETQMVIIDPVAWEFAKRMELVTPDFNFVKLEINGQNHGVRLLYEDIDQYFLERNGLMGFIFTEKKGHFPFHYSSSNDEDYPQVKVINKKGSTLDELRWLNKVLSYPSTEQFGKNILKIVDLEQILTWHSHALICGSGHQNIHNIQLFFNSALQKFQFIPWDIAGFSHWQHEPRKMWAMNLDWCTNNFIYRLNQIPEFVEKRNRILWKYLNGDLSLEKQLKIVDKYYKKVRYHLYVDDLKQASEEKFSNKEFEESIIHLKGWIKKRYDFMISELAPADLRVSVNPLNESKSYNGLVISLGTGKQSGVQLRTLRIPLVKQNIDENNIRLYLDSNANDVIDNDDREIRPNVVKLNNGVVEISVEQLLLPARGIYLDSYFDFWDKGYMLQARPFYKYYNFFVVYSKDKSANKFDNVFSTEIKVESVNSVTGKPIQPDYLTVDKEKIFALTYKEKSSLNGTGTFTNNDVLFDIGRDNNNVDLKTYLKKLNDKKNVIIPSGNYTLNDNWKIGKDEVVTITDGTNIKLNPGVSIFVRGILNINGHAESPVILENAIDGQPWGSLIYYKTSHNSRLNYVTIRYAGMAKMENVNFTGGVSAYDATIFMKSCVFDQIRADDGINVKNSETRLLDCRFLQIKDDAIDYDNSGGEITNCYIYKPGGDAIDCGEGARPKIIGNLIEYPNDKCISVGEASSPTIQNNILIGGQYGIAVKDDSHALIKGNTICKNRIGIAFYVKKPDEFGCPTAIINQCIVWDNEISIENICDAKFEIRKSAVMGGYDGEKIFTEPPEFETNSKGNLYMLKVGSMYSLRGIGAQREIM